MSSFELSSPNDRNGVGDHPQDGGNKNLEAVSLRMLEIAEKLESVNQQCHILEVENKVLHNAHEGGPDLNTFVSARVGASRPSTPAKRRSNFLIPPVAGTSKGLSARKTFGNLTPTQQFEALHQIAKEQSDVVLNFEGLKKAIFASQMSSSLKKAIGLRKDTGDQSFPTVESSASKEREPEEIAFIKDILGEQDDLNEKIMEIEKERLGSTLNLLSSKMEVAKEFAVTKEIYKDMISCKGNDDDGVGHDEENEENDENSDNSNKEIGDEEGTFQKKIEKKKNQLNREEARLNQMRFLVQKLMGSCPNNAMIFDEVTNKLHYDMILKCGQDISKLRGDEDV